MKFFKGIATGCLGFLATITISAASASEVDFSGKTIEWIIPFTETGGSARWANFFAPLLSQNLPGNPTVIVKFRPGAGSTRGANWFQEQKDTEGLLMFGSSASTLFAYLLGDRRVRYEYSDWIPVMASGTGGVVYLNADDAEQFDGSADGLQDQTFVYGNQGATRLDLIPALAFRMLGMDVEHVMGIKGRGDGRKMMEIGETTIDHQTSPSYLKSVAYRAEEGEVVPIMTWGILQGRIIVREPNFPELLTFKEVCQATAGCETSGPAWEAWKSFFIAGFPAQKIAFLPGDTPPEIIEAYEKAFAAIKARPDFFEISSAQVGSYPMFVGSDAQRALDQAITVSDSALIFIKEWLKEDFDQNLN